MLIYLAAVAICGLAGCWLVRRTSAVTPLTRSTIGGLGLGVLGLVLAEAYLQFGYDATDTNRIRRTTSTWITRHVARNSHGFRDDGWTLRVGRNDGLFRIGVVGSGATFGQGVEDVRDRFSELIESRLNARGDTLEYQVMNIGEMGGTTQDQIVAIRDLLPFLKLDELILAYEISDVRDLTFTDARLEQLDQTRSSLERWMGDRSLVLDHWLTQKVRTQALGVLYAGTRAGYTQNEAWRYQVSRLTQFGEAAAMHGVTLRVAILPMLAESWDNYTLRSAHDQVTNVFAIGGQPVLELTDIIEATGEPVGVWWASRADVYPNERAHLLIADAMLREWYDLNP